MICKNCQKEMPELGEFCPFCGMAKEAEVPEGTIIEEIAAEEIVEGLPEQEVIAQEEKPKLKLWKLILLIVGGVALLGVLVWAVLYGLGIDLTPKGNNILCKSAYSVEAEEATKQKDVVVATIGDKKLTNSELQLYYENILTSFYYENYYYMSMMGVDMTQPLSEQVCMMDESKTWEQYFLENALTNWQAYTVVEIMAEQAGYELDPEMQASIDALPGEVEIYAIENGYESVDAYLAENMGVNVNLVDYMHFYEVYYVCNDYLDDLYIELYPTADEIEAYFAANKQTLAANGITKDMGLLSNVRHILVSVEGGTENEDGTVTYSEEEWNTALAEAEKILQEWKDGEATEDSFAHLATSYTDDTASAPTGGLYTDISIESSYVEPFLNWSVDAARQAGDTEIVKTEFGYHIMYFVSGEDYFSFLVAEEIIANQVQLQLLMAKEEYPMEVNYKKIYLAPSTIM